MTMKSLDALDLKEEALPDQSFDDLPEFGAFVIPPQPGPYRFKLPGSLDQIWDTTDTAKGQRVQMILDRDNPLLIIASPGGVHNGETFRTRLSNLERKRGKDGPEASDLDYLLRAFKMTSRPKTNRQYIDAVRAHAGQEFGADISFSYGCNKKKNIWVMDQAQDRLVEVDGRKGCGKRYYQKDIPVQAKVEGKFPLQIQCECGAVVRVFANLDNIRS